jgi:dihydroxyacetone kinase DhaKLM complex PTS-EIIA-like component DhaM
MAQSAQGVDLDATIAALQQEPTTSIPMADAIAMIDGWKQQLEGEDIAADLDELRQALESGDRDDIVAVLADLGEYTSEIAVDLPAEVSEKVAQIGMLLSQMAIE